MSSSLYPDINLTEISNQVQPNTILEFKVGKDINQKIYHVPYILLIRVRKILSDRLGSTPQKVHLPIYFHRLLKIHLRALPLRLSYRFWQGDILPHVENHKDGEQQSFIIDLCILASKWKVANLHNQYITALTNHRSCGFTSHEVRK